jgi:hypothetical protein
MLSTVPLLVRIAQEPVVRTKTRPTCVPAVSSAPGTTRSAVMKPATIFWHGRSARGKPYLVHSVRQCCPGPLALITNVLSFPGMTPARSPTERASSAWLFSIPQRALLQGVRPPLQVPMGRAGSWRAAITLKRVALTAADTWASTSGCPHSAAVRLPLVVFQS